MSPQSEPHRWLVNRLYRRLAILLDGRAACQSHSHVRSEDSRPEPDLTVFPLDEERFDRAPEHPYLVVEVSDSSRRKDLGPKARLYAVMGIPTYWVFDLPKHCVRIHRDPSDGEYRIVQTLTPGNGAQLVLAEFPDVELPLDELFPWPAP